MSPAMYTVFTWTIPDALDSFQIELWRLFSQVTVRQSGGPVNHRQHRSEGSGIFDGSCSNDGSKSSSTALCRERIQPG